MNGREGATVSAMSVFRKKQLREAESFGYLMKFGGSFQVFVVVPLNRVIWEEYWSEKGAPLLFNKISNFCESLNYIPHQQSGCI